jgi:perosamine synthetase
MMEIPIFNTYIDPSAASVIGHVLQSTFLSEGKLVREFESKLYSEFGIYNAVALNSGTSALHLALDVAGISEGDEVIIPAQTFVATGLVVLQKKAIPVFADVDYHTGNISVESIKQKITAKTKAIIPVHWGGYPCDMDEINDLAKQNNIIVIEDAAHALGASYKGRAIGSISDYTCFSFQAIKHLTTGDGGALACLNDAARVKAMTGRWFGIDRNHARLSLLGERQYDIEKMGYKYHMNDYAAALGLANMNNFFVRLVKRIEYADIYRQELNSLNGISLFQHNDDRKSAHWLFGFHVEKREDFIQALKAKGISSSVIHQRIDRNSVFGGLRMDLPAQELFDQTQIHIPLHDALDMEKVNYIIDCIKQGW